MIIRRSSEIVIVLLILLIIFPFWLLISVTIKINSPGSIFYKSKRVGKNGKNFNLFKFRTMHLSKSNTSLITSKKDNRIFLFGRLLRNSKIDETPQLLNILLGDMSFAGPRPEDPYFVNKYYLPIHEKTLTIRPGLYSTGTIYYYTHLEDSIDEFNPEKKYIEEILPIKLALDIYYINHKSLIYDIRLTTRTILAIFNKIFGLKLLNAPKELNLSNKYVHPMKYK